MTSHPPIQCVGGPDCGERLQQCAGDLKIGQDIYISCSQKSKMTGLHTHDHLDAHYVITAPDVAWFQGYTPTNENPPNNPPTL